MKVIIIGTAYPHRGGIAHFNALLFQAFQKRDHDISMISFTRQYPSLFFPGKTQYEDGEEIIPVNAKPMLDSIGPISWLKVAKSVRNINPDLVIFKYWMPFFAPAYSCISYLIKRRRATKVLFVCDNIIPHERRLGDTFLTKIAVSTVDHFIVMSKSVEENLLTFKPNASFKRVEHPVYEIFGKSYSKNEARRQLEIESSDPIILFFGFIRKYKGLQLLLEAMPAILKKKKAKLLIAGEFYDDSSNYLNLIEKLNLKQDVILKTDFIPNEKVGLFFSAADVVALPYLSATQSGVIQIAYHYNRPVVATPVGGLPEVVLQDKTGFVVSEINADSLAQGIVRTLDFLKDVNFEKHISQFKKRFSWDFMVETIEKLVGEK